MLPNKESLQNVCKSLAVLDAILCQDWEYRYYSYNKNWAENEECFTMRNGEGDELLILFKNHQCILNGFLSEEGCMDKSKLKEDVPAIFQSFIFGEPIITIGTTFCIWSDEYGNWNPEDVDGLSQKYADFMNMYTTDPRVYLYWAIDYYETDTLNYDALNVVFNEKELNTKDVLNINEELEDWDQLKEDLDEIGYSYNFEA
jgi:hypothetical protein